VEQKAPDELVGCERHQLELVVVAISRASGNSPCRRRAVIDVEELFQ
jgi:hypothetical protein